MKTEAGELSIGDVVRDPNGHRGPLGLNVPGESAWGKVYAITSDPEDSEVRFLYEFMDADGTTATGRVGRASYDHEAPLEFHS